MNTSKKYLLSAIAAAAALFSAKPAMADIDIKPNTNGQVEIVVDFEVKPGKEAEFEQTFKRSVMCSRLEPGNITFNVHSVIDAPRHYVLYEQWRSTEALNSHFARPYTKALFSMFDRDLVHPVTDGGLRFIQEIDPAQRSAPATTDPASLAECR